jgi:hypothetical protein
MKTPFVVLSVIFLAFVAGVGSANAAGDLLPDLGIGQINTIQVDTTSMRGHVLLRYAVKLANVGAGTLRLRGTRSSTSQTDMSVVQKVAQSAGGYRTVTTSAVMEYQKGKWRVGAAESGWLEDAGGNEVGKVVKHWYCTTDSVAYDLSLPGAPQRKAYGGCGTGKPDLLAITVGVSVGWADYYPVVSFQQYVDITGLPDGTYYLYSDADPNNDLLESNDSNNTTWTEFALANGTITIVAYGPHI